MKQGIISDIASFDDLIAKNKDFTDFINITNINNQ